MSDTLRNSVAQDHLSRTAVAGETWHCRECGKANMALAKFCGGCGRPAGIVRPLPPPFPPFRDLFSRNRELMMVLAAFFVRMPRTWRLGLGALLLVFVSVGFCFVPGLTSDVEPITWQIFRSYLAGRLDLVVTDLDLLAGKSWDRLPDPAQRLSLDHVIRLERTLQDLLQDAGFSLFPNPFFGLPPKGSAGTDPKHERGLLFVDVPVDHPVYLAWQPLLALGLGPGLGGSALEARPYDRLTWEEWTGLARRTWTSLFPATRAPPDLVPDRQGSMNARDLAQALATWRILLGLPDRLANDNTDGIKLPSRLEGFGELAGLLQVWRQQG